MITLAIDTASADCAIAVWEGGPDGRLRAQVRRHLGRGHGEVLFELVAEALGEAAIAPADITRLAAMRGPGSFTGLRIGLSAVRGLALALDAEAMALTAFELAAAAESEASGERVVRMIAIDARRGELYVCVLGPDLEIISAPALLSLPDTVAMLANLSAPRIVLTTAAQQVAQQIAQQVADEARRQAIEVDARPASRASASLLARIAASRTPADHPPDPLYIRPPDAKLPSAAPLRKEGR